MASRKSIPALIPGPSSSANNPKCRPAAGISAPHPLTLAVHLAIASSLIATAGWAPVAHAQVASESETQTQADDARQYDIPPGPLSTVLTRFSTESGLFLGGATESAQGKTSKGLQGRYTAEEGLQVLLADSGLDYQFAGERRVTLLAQESDESVQHLKPITVTATRNSQGRPLSSIPGSVTVIEREQIEEQSAMSDDFGAVLTQLVPGLGPSSQSLTNFGQTLRGRDMLILIDGVPQTTPLRDGARSLRIIDPATVERIEVIRGSAATYGYGATGGIINIITRQGDAGEPSFRTELGVSGALGQGRDGLGGHLTQSVEGGSDRADYALTAKIESIGSFFDANDNRIAPDAFHQGGGLADSESINLQAKLGYALTPKQRLQFSGSYYEIKQDTDYVLDQDPTDPAFAVKGTPDGVEPGTENLSLTLDHTAEEVFGGTLSSQLYYQDLEAIFSAWGDEQSKIISEKLGARIAHERPFVGASNVVYGVDFLRDETAQPWVGKSVVFTPYMEQSSYAPFAQFEFPLGENWLLLSGVRHEMVNLDVDDYTTVDIAPRVVAGGELDYSETLFNLGAVYFLNQQQELFASFSQGFSVADVGRTLRGTSAASVGELDPEAQVVDNYEIGWRGYFDQVEGSVSLFYNTSDLGTTFDQQLNIRRQKEEIYGIEATADWEVTERWQLGGSFAWQEGKTDTDDDGRVDSYLPATRISPLKLTAYGEYSPSERWNARLQLTHFGDRSHDDYSEAFGGVDVDNYTLVDAMGSAKAGPGRVRFGVSNLFNEDYITPLGNIYGEAGDARGGFFETYWQPVPGRGRTFFMSYAINY